MTHEQTTLAHFRIHGWMRVPAAFTAAEAATMRDAVWRALEDVGIHRERPSTWTTERPTHLQHLKTDPVFQAVRSNRLRAAIDAVLESSLATSRRAPAHAFSHSRAPVNGARRRAAGILMRTT